MLAKGLLRVSGFIRSTSKLNQLASRGRRLASQRDSRGSDTQPRCMVELVNLNEQWNEFIDARGALFKDITARGLPTPE